MQTERQRRIRQVFDAAIGQPPELQEEFVRRSAGGDHDTERTVLRLLRASRKNASFLAQPVWHRDASPAEGTNIGPYKIIRELGSGGMGLVYLCVRSDEVFRKVVALKVLRADFRTAPLLRHFQNERQILARLDHPNIARILDGGTTPTGLPYYVMDYVDGLPLDVFCRQRSANLQQTLNLFRQICNAVNYLHQNQTIHRDLKPANILVTADGMVKLLDFGIAKLVDEANVQQPSTLPLLTVGYASPEQLRRGAVGPASDIYSLGVILYELLTGVRPHDLTGRSLPQVIVAVSEEEPIKPSTRVAKGGVPGGAGSADRHIRLHKDLDSIVMMALRKEPQRRYGTAADFAADVQRFQRKEPVIARKNSLLYVGTRLIQRKWKAVAATLVMVASVSVAGWETNQARRAKVELERFRKAQIQLTKQADVLRDLPDVAKSQALQKNLALFSTEFGEPFRQIVQHKYGSAEDREEIARQGLVFLNHVAPQAVELSEAQPAEALGRAYLSLAKAQWDRNAPSLMDPIAASTTCESGLDILGPETLNFSDSVALRQVTGELGTMLRQSVIAQK